MQDSYQFYKKTVKGARSPLSIACHSASKKVYTLISIAHVTDRHEWLLPYASLVLLV
jgi:hypothetical protein